MNEEAKRQDEILEAPDREPLSEQEWKIVDILRSIDYGEMRIVVKDGAAVHIEEIKKSIKL